MRAITSLLLISFRVMPCGGTGGSTLHQHNVTRCNTYQRLIGALVKPYGAVLRSLSSLAMLLEVGLRMEARVEGWDWSLIAPGANSVVN